MRVAILAGYDGSLINFRGALLSAMVASGHEVIALAPLETPGVASSLEALGVRYIPINLSRTGMNLFADLKFRRELNAVLRRERPDLFLAYTIKPIVYGIPAAWRESVPRRVALVTGLGAAFNTDGWRGKLMRMLATKLYRIALRRCTLILTQNSDIVKRFLDDGVIYRDAPIGIVSGSGVDIARFSPAACPDGPPVFLLLARMLRDKGIMEYVAAARFVRDHIPGARFLLVGDPDLNPSAIPLSQLDAWNRENVIEYRRAVPDVRSLLAECSTFVLPSYHEGMPRSVLEAMSTGRPVITTDAIGCRDTVINAGRPDTEGIRTGENGLLVPVKSVEPLAKAMLRLAHNRVLAAQMGARGREIAAERFDVHKVNRQMMEAMGLVGTKG